MFWNMRRCKRCGILYPETLRSFASDRTASAGLSTQCRGCRTAYHRKHYLENRTSVLQKCAAYRDSHLEQAREVVRLWHIENKEYVREYRKRRAASTLAERAEAQKVRYATDPQYREKVKLLRRLDHALRGTSARSAATAVILGCDQLELRKHIERQFQPGMTWDNRGKGLLGWQIDHIVPCCRFDLRDEQQQKLCFNYTNLRPLWSVDNLKKGSKNVYTDESKAPAGEHQTRQMFKCESSTLQEL